MAAKAGAGEAARFAEAHRRLLADRAIQFDLPAFAPPKPPDWLEPLIRLLRGLGPEFRILFWGIVAALVGLLLYFLAGRLRDVRWGGRGAEEAAATDWQPEAAAARALLHEADALAAAGRFAEAAHLLLFRSVEDIAAKRPGIVRPALTSRDIARAEGLPQGARGAFQLIAEMVERSLFGGREVDGEGWRRCRAAYEDFALSGAWA